MTKAPLPGPLAWITGEYIRVSHTFIQREVAGLRSAGLDVQTFSIRRSGPDQLVGPEQRDEAARTFYVLDAARRPLGALRAHAAVIGRAPRVWVRTLRAAWRTAPAGIRGRLYGLIYFHEAAVLAQELRARGAVHLHNHFATASCTVARLAAPLAGIPWSFTIHGPDDFLQPEQWRLDDKVAQAAFVVCISEYARAQVMRRAKAADWPKLHIVHCGVEPERYDSEGLGTVAVTKAADRLLFVGRLAVEKGLPVLLDALVQARKERPTLRLTVVGDGPERAAIEAQARALELTDIVEFTGYKGQEEVAEMLRHVTALVLPSYAEGVPVVLMEALAAGLPVVSTRVAGIAELVEDGVSGRLVDPGDRDALTQAILEVTGDAGVRMAGAGQTKVRAEFDSRREAARIAVLVHWATANGPRPELRPALQSDGAPRAAQP